MKSTAAWPRDAARLAPGAPGARNAALAPPRFFQTVLRTLEVEAARAFYARVLGPVPLEVVRLHEQALARGARPHWLPFLEVPDVDRAVAAFTGLGASPMGAKWVNPQGLEAAYLRDPGGALLALGRPPPGAPAWSGPEVAWWLLNTADVDRCRAAYAAAFGWDFGPPLDLGSLGVFHPFAWTPGGPQVGSMSDLRGREGVHPHWLMQARVADLDAAVAAVRQGGGQVLGDFALPSGGRLAVCDDPQGAAFSVRTG